MTRYKDPPVTEVVAEFIFLPTNWDWTVPGLLYEHIKPDFPVRKMAGNPALMLPMGGVPGQLLIPNPMPRVDRIQFHREDEKMVVQVGPDLLVVNNVKMWTEWEDFFPTVKSVFERYRLVVDNWKVQRLGLQYINQLKLPVASPDRPVELEDYLEFYPHTGKRLPDHGPFSVSVQFPRDPKDPTQDWTEIQLSGLGLNPDGRLHANLNIKCYSMMPRDLDVDGIYNWMQQAHRDVVNKFEGSITDKLRDTFGGTV